LRDAHERVFSEIWRNNLWGDRETRSGPGSTVVRTEGFRRALEGFLQQVNPGVLYDAPCGDFNWMRLVRLPPQTGYIGADVVPELIALLERNHASDHRRFLLRDVVFDAPPDADVWLCRESLFHLSLAEIGMVIDQWRESSISYFLATTSTAITTNTDIATGGWRPINMEIDPFTLGPPQLYLPDAAPSDPSKVVGVWRK
jgi:hypothetical protein